MSALTPTGARILDTNENGVVTGHAAALDRLRAGGLIERRAPDGHQVMTDAGHEALAAWRTTKSPSPPAS